MLAEAGGHPVIADINVDRGKSLADELGGAFVPTDVTDDSMAAAAAQAVGKPLRLAVICAGIGVMARTVAWDGTPFPSDVYRRVIDVNLVGTFSVLRRAVAAMAQTEPLVGGERGLLSRQPRSPPSTGRLGSSAARCLSLSFNLWLLSVPVSGGPG